MIEKVDHPASPEVVACEDYGVGIPSAELRSSVAFTDAEGHPRVLGVPLDMGRPYLIMSDAVTGETHQYYMPEGVTGFAFGSALTEDGKYVIGMSENLVFDVNSRTYVRAGKSCGETICAGIAPDGTVYLGAAPGAYMVAVDPAAGTSRNLGRMDDREEYVQSIAVDREGIVYCGIGTARANIVAYDPVSGARTQLMPEELRDLTRLMPEEVRERGSASVTEGEDGCVYAVFGDFRIKCLGGKIIGENVSCPRPAGRRQLKYGTHLRDFGNGMKLLEYDLTKRSMIVERRDGGRDVFGIDYVSGGLELTSMALGAEGVPYFSSAHPHHLGRLEIGSGKIVDLGFNGIVGGGNFCNMTAHGDKLYGCEYSGGRLWEYSYDRPYAVTPDGGAEAGGETVRPENNPRVLGQWEELVTRPRAIAVTPSGREIVMSGFAGYGFAGGGMGIHNLATGGNRCIREILPGESCIAMDFMPDGNLAGGTSIDAPGGGHVSAGGGSVFIMDWANGKVVRHAATGAANVVAVAFWEGRIYAAADDARMYVFEPSELTLEDKIDISGYGCIVRNAFQKTPDGRMLFIMEKMLFSVERRGLKKLLIPDRKITGGGPVIGDRLYFIHDLTGVGSVRIPARRGERAAVQEEV